MFLKANKSETSVLNNAVKKPVPSVISSELHILGNLVSVGHIDIDGTVEGNVKAAFATIRGNGRVSGDVIAETVHIYGEVRGLIHATAVHLHSSCRVEGVILYQALSIEEGAEVDAKFKRTQDKAGSDQGRNPLIIEGHSDEEDALEAKSLNNLRLIG